MIDRPDAFLRQFAETRRFMSGRPVSPVLTPDEQTVLFLRAGPRDAVQKLFAFDVATGQTRELLSPEVLLAGAEQTLSSEEKARLERMRVSARGFTCFSLSEDGSRILVTLSGKPYVVERESGKVRALRILDGAVLDARFSPDGKQVGYVRNHDVYRIPLATGTERRVTRGGTAAKPNGLAEFVAQEEMSRWSGYWWSQDAKQVAFAEVDHSGVEELSIVDVMHPEQGAQTFAYPRAGKRNASVRLGIARTSGGSPTWVKWDAKAYPYLATVVWPKKGPLTLLVQNRTQTEEVLLAADPRTGNTRPLLTERDAAWINLEQDFPVWLEDGTGFLWYTERNGGPEIELRAADGSLRSSLVKLATGVLQLSRYVEKDGTLYVNGGPNPTESALWRVKAGGKLERVPGGSPGPAWDVARVSKAGNVLLLQTQSLQQMPRTYVQKVDGTRLGELPSVAVEPPFAPRVELRQVGRERFHTALLHPRGAAAGKKLPVIVEVYGGPTHTKVRHQMAPMLLAQWLADHGFLVAMVDGRGTPGRGAKWERAVHRNFAGVTLEDTAAGLEALAKEVPELDLKRVGVEGWSFGGYLAALSVLKRPDLFKASVAGAPVVDWLDYDTHYTERYLGLPQEQPEAYQKSSLLTYAAKLQRPLLLIHGTADDNVYFFHTLKLSDALFLAGKKHDLLPLSGLTHLVPDPLVTERQWQRVVDYFREHL